MKKLTDLKNRFIFLLTKNKCLDEKFSVDFLTLIRIGCLGGTLLGSGYFIILLTLFRSYLHTAILGLIIIVIFSLFIISYYQTKHFLTTVYVFCIFEAIMLTYLVFLFGTAPGYHVGIMFLIFVIFYKTDGNKSKRFDMIISIATIVYSFAVWCIVNYRRAILPVSFRETFLLSVGFNIWIGLSIITLAWFYHIKFAKDEEDLLQYNDRLKEMSKRDELTKLQNRRGISEYIQDITKSCSVLYFVMCDIDFFKKVNDNYGHDIGDKVLVRIAEIIQDSLDKRSMIGRWGGEEFLIIIPDMHQQRVLDLIENIRLKIASEVFYVTESKKFIVTMTFGISEYYSHLNSVDQSIKRADENLYRGKQSGRNCAIF